MTDERERRPPGADDLAAALRRLADHAAAHAARGPDAPAFRRAPAGALGGLRDIPAKGRPLDEALGDLLERALPYGMDTGHRRFFAFIPAPVSPLSWLGELAAQIHNPHAGAALQSEGADAIERAVVEFLCEAAGFPETAGGLFVSGGSTANLTALCVARDHMLGADERAAGVAYVTAETHASVAKALRILGFLDRQIRVVETDDGLRMNVWSLASMAAADRADGRRPFVVAASAGTTSTGAVDPLPALADFCADEALWLHVDGAHGASALLSPAHRGLLSGVERADSLAWDAHKWLFQSYGCGVVLMKDRRHLAPSFSLAPDYLRDGAAEGGEPNFWDMGPELTRPARALRLWLTLQAMGRQGLGAAIARGFALAEAAERAVRGLSGWEVVSPAQMAILCFRYAPEGLAPERADEINAAIARRLMESGFAVVGTTLIGGRRALRICAIHPETSEDDIRETLGRLDALAREAVG